MVVVVSCCGGGLVPWWLCLVVLILGFVLVAVCLGGLVVLGFVLPHSYLVICGLFLLVAGSFIFVACIGGWV